MRARRSCADPTHRMRQAPVAESIWRFGYWRAAYGKTLTVYCRV